MMITTGCRQGEFEHYAMRADLVPRGLPVTRSVNDARLEHFAT